MSANPSAPKLNTMRYLTFEVNRACPLRAQHPKCPIGHPERYRFGKQEAPLTDGLIMDFWRWCRERDFRGIVLWHWYSEPALVLPRLRSLMREMRAEDPGQPFQLFTARKDLDLSDFDLIKITDYESDKELDDRIAAAFVEGDATPHQPAGWCGRGWGWELLVDHYANWCLCCNDWRAEESVGNLWRDDWSEMLRRYHAKATHLRWHDQDSWEALPRMCRSCMRGNFSLHQSGGTFYVPE